MIDEAKRHAWQTELTRLVDYADVSSTGWVDFDGYIRPEDLDRVAAILGEISAAVRAATIGGIQIVADPSVPPGEIQIRRGER